MKWKILKTFFAIIYQQVKKKNHRRIFIVGTITNEDQSINCFNEIKFFGNQILGELSHQIFQRCFNVVFWLI